MKRQRNGGGRSRPSPATRRADADSLFGGAAPEDFTSGDDFFRRSAGRKADQKARQLCRQVYRTLSVALPGCGDAVLQDLTVVAVDPAPDAGHLLVTVSAGTLGGDADNGNVGNGASNVGDTENRPPVGLDIVARLAGAAGRLRAEVARDIVRKRAPELSFRVIPRGEVTP
jgi:ribosome-binding factor A